MKELRKKHIIVLMFLLFTILSVFFTNTGYDWYYSSWNSIQSILDGRLLSKSLIILFTKYKLIKVISFGIFASSLIFLLRNMVNKKNNTLLLLAISLLFLIDKSILSVSLVNTTGFVLYFISSLFLLIFINFIIKDTIKKIHPLILFIFGLVSSLLLESTSLTVLLVSIYLLVKSIIKKSNIKNYVFLLIGSLIGSTSTLLKTPLDLAHVFYKLIHNTSYVYSGANFLIILIFIAFLFFLSIKIFVKGNIKYKIYTLISTTSITLSAVIFIISQNALYLYIGFVLFSLASIFVLCNSTSSKLFKRRIIIYYIFKIGLIYAESLFASADSINVIFPVLIDILIILELINYVFPNNFLIKPWIVITCFLFLANIYAYKVNYYRMIDMNKYIKNEASCGIKRIIVPAKYENNLLYMYLPNTDWLPYYNEYYNIENTDYLVNFLK